MRLSPRSRRAFFFSGTIDLLMEKTIKTLAELEVEAARFVGSLHPEPNTATLITLSGELGAGKTTLTKAVAEALGVEELVTSPTFVIEKIYLLGGKTAKFERLIHIDAYRLEGGGDLAPLGFDELLLNTGNLILLEWPEKVSDLLPTPDKRIMLTAHPDGSRTISYG